MQKQIIKGIIGAIIGAALLYFVSFLFMVIGNLGDVYSIIFIIIGAVAGFLIGQGEKNKKFGGEKFFSLSWTKVSWVIFLAILTLFCAFVFMDVTPDSGMIYYIGTIYGWILTPGSMLMGLIPSMDCSTNNILCTIATCFPFLALLLWDYLLICLVFYIIRKFKKIKI